MIAVIPALLHVVYHYVGGNAIQGSHEGEQILALSHGVSRLLSVMIEWSQTYRDPDRFDSLSRCVSHALIACHR